jgi:hypothetical protein
MQAEQGLDLSFAVGLRASIESLATEVKRQNDRHHRLAQAIHPFTIPPMPLTITSSAGSIYQPNITGPQMSKYWDVHRISVTGYSAGTVAVYLNQVGAELVANFTTPATGSIVGCQYFGKGHLVLTGNDSLYFSATGITAASGYLTISIAGVEIESAYIGDYFA